MKEQVGSPLSILFVCTGNICRSPLAAGLFRQAAAAELPPIRVESAGIQALVGAHADPQVRAIAANYSINLDQHRGRQLQAHDFVSFDHLIALDLGHLDYMTAIRPANARAEISLLLSFGDPANVLEVPDPYGRSKHHFQRAATLIEKGVGGLLASLIARHA